MTMKIQWQDPGPPKAGPGSPNDRSDPRRIAMKEHPRRWLLWASGVAPHVSQAVKRYGGPGFEAVARNHRIENGRSVADIYARYVGDGPGAYASPEDGRGPRAKGK